jgi:hypothetical protein
MKLRLPTKPGDVCTLAVRCEKCGGEMRWGDVWIRSSGQIFCGFLLIIFPAVALFVALNTRDGPGYHGWGLTALMVTGLCLVLGHQDCWYCTKCGFWFPRRPGRIKQAFRDR